MVTMTPSNAGQKITPFGGQGLDEEITTTECHFHLACTGLAWVCFNSFGGFSDLSHIGLGSNENKSLGIFFREINDRHFILYYYSILVLFLNKFN